MVLFSRTFGGGFEKLGTPASFRWRNVRAGKGEIARGNLSEHVLHVVRDYCTFYNVHSLMYTYCTRANKGGGEKEKLHIIILPSSDTV